MLQRLTEDLEYADCLDKAAACENSWEQVRSRAQLNPPHEMSESRETSLLLSKCSGGTIARKKKTFIIGVWGGATFVVGGG